MSEVVTALVTMGLVVAAGWLIQARGWLPHGSREILATVCFSIASPCLLLATVAHADLGTLASRGAAVTWGTSLALAGVLVVIARWGMRLPAGRATITALSGSYVNAGNLGLPLAVYLFGDALAVVPTMLVQLLVMAPVAFGVLGRAADATPLPIAASRVRDDGDAPVRKGAVASAILNPLTLATLAGLVLALLPWSIPEAALEPFSLVGAAAPPLALLTLGMSLAKDVRMADAPVGPGEDGGMGAGLAGSRGLAAPLGLAIAARAVVHPALTWLVGSLAGLEGTALTMVVAMAALPTAQNVVVYANRYRCSVDVASRACVATTALCGPVLVVVSAVA
ncbi:AEC family transporter [Demequina sp. NBRC 110055]|uniref:AEC family transporter n=1 Tax=Demequina sp. NBRC 110055 TaxID=1570344 RepID=UPI000A003BD5|nr:AEC family transporter [Demequina sp. NBRC 110055]